MVKVIVCLPAATQQQNHDKEIFTLFRVADTNNVAIGKPLHKIERTSPFKACKGKVCDVCKSFERVLVISANTTEVLNLKQFEQPFIAQCRPPWLRHGANTVDGV